MWIKLQGEEEKRSGIYYAFDSDSVPLGEGGMGRVFRGQCVDMRSGATTDVAIKAMYTGLPAHVIERARREASIRLQNDNLIRMLGFVCLADAPILGQTQKHYHVVSEYLRGVMLADMMKEGFSEKDCRNNAFLLKMLHLWQTDRRAFALHIIRCVLSGVQALHDKGYIHRDIDPTNIMLTEDGKVKLIDFGIAKPLSALAEDTHLTNPGVFMGKPEYASPELVDGDVARQNYTTDVYSIGILLFYLLAGELPFCGSMPEVLKMQKEKPLPLKRIPFAEMRSVVKSATEKKQSKRFQSVAEFRVALDKAAVESPPFGAMPSDIRKEEKPFWQKKQWMAAAVALLFLVSGGAGWYFFRPASDEDAEAWRMDSVSVDVADVMPLDSVAAWSVAEALTNLKEADGLQNKALQQLETLAALGSTEALMILSNLYAEDPSDTPFCPADSIRLIRGMLDAFQTDEERSVRYAVEAVEYDVQNRDALRMLLEKARAGRSVGLDEAEIRYLENRMSLP